MAQEGDINEKIRALREQYALEALDSSEVADEPMRQLSYWMDEAVKAEVWEPNAMTLATADEQGRPSTRIVLIRELSEKGPVFFTNYQSRKGKELATNPSACGNLFWPELQRQVRLEGSVERIEEERSDAYFNSRPYTSRLGAWASEQSKEIPSREALEEALKRQEETFDESTIERPDHWGGYCLLIERAEFWQGRPDRLHDRIELIRDQKGWKKRRLSP